MSKSESNNGGGGIGFFGMLTILFIGLKLTDNVDWSWWWVFSPILFSISLFVIVLGTLSLVGLFND